MKVSFKAKGKTVSFQKSSRRRAKKLTAHNKFVGSWIKKHGGSMSPRAAMRAANRAWNKK